MKVARVVSYASKFTKQLEDEFKRRTRIAAEKVRKELRQNLSKPGGPNQASAAGEYPRTRSGKLVRGVYTKLSKSSPYTFRVLNRAAYNDPLEYGSKGGKTITPKRAKVLAFPAKGGTVFTKRVRRGTIRPRSHARRTLESLRPVLKAIYTRGISGMLQGNRANLRLG